MSKMIGASEQPLICTPLVGKKRENVLGELADVLAKKPDIIEWRADFFEEIDQTDRVINLAKEIKEMAGDIPLIFTIRSIREGGQPIPLSDEEAIELNATICRNTKIEYVDCELSNKKEHIQYLRKIAAENGTRIVASYHNFDSTPSQKFIAQKLEEAEQYQLDVAKVAVMPQKLEDVLTLLSVTLEAKNRLKIPLITMSMGKYGAISRMIGGVFGSALTFAVGAKSSAPGQVPIEDLKTVLEVIERSMKSK
ncbi:3-dehydroquinate dehydratase [Candidatus Formimonas warabiya]|uniref:3-dehydroquinate dehydratase n=2 Tax=Formimonas warabiya TaxID=1761012 RepID=A0A3G1L122_FORW1|nr:3-dehydroquinate dehydratase [Candidatus Formimonas warabiya]